MSAELMPIREFDFQLPRGLVDSQGEVHRFGRMRLATARDEMVRHRDRQASTNGVYGDLVMLSLVITKLGSFSNITLEILEGLFTVDLAYLREFYNRINQQLDSYIPAHCPHCDTEFGVELELAGEY